MKTYLLVFSLSLFLAAFLSGFVEQLSATSPVKEIETIYHQYLTEFASQTQQLQQAANALEQQPASVAQLQEAFRQTRYAFKHIEFLASYLDAEFVDDFINGPPLLSIVRNAPSLHILEPEGLQVLEEQIFSEKPYQEKQSILALTAALAKRSRELANFQSKIYLTDRHIFEAARAEMIRIFALGVTGFDAPVTLNSLPEAQRAWSAVSEVMQLYDVLLDKQNPNLRDSLEEKLQQGEKYLQTHQDFDTFDRLAFLKQYVNPVYKLLLEAQLALHIETYYETTPLNRKYAVNYLATNIFAQDFLDPYYYARMPESKAKPEVVALGRMLFFDPVLSGNNRRSCASCHQPDKGFTDNSAKSLAMDHQGTVDRNAPTLLNAAYADRFFYDLRTDLLEDQIDHVVADHREFGTSYLSIFSRINQSEEYRTLFAQAFPEVQAAPVNKYSLSTALAAYVVSLQSFNSPFDQYVRGEIDTLDTQVQQGFNLFMGKAACGTCHFAPTFSGNVPPVYHESESEVLGVPASPDTLHPILDTDRGRYYGALKEHAPFYEHSFKTTTVRNVALSAPYMHNGVYETLEEVVDFYNRGGGAGLGLEVPNQTLSPDPLHLTTQEKQQLIAFMQSLTDTTHLNVVPESLPMFANHPAWNKRKIGGEY